jgi:hypothetical protein
VVRVVADRPPSTAGRIEILLPGARQVRVVGRDERQVLVMLLTIAAVWPPRGVATKSVFLRSRVMCFIGGRQGDEDPYRGRKRQHAAANACTSRATRSGSKSAGKRKHTPPGNTTS